MSLCRACREAGATACIAQGLWNETERAFNQRAELLKASDEFSSMSPAIEKVNNEAREQLIRDRAQGAREYRRYARSTHCRNLKIMPFAR